MWRFQSGKEGSADIWVVGSEGEDPRPFVVHPAEEVWSAWSRDGKWFYFTSNRSNVFEVWVRPAGDGEARGNAYADAFEGVDLAMIRLEAREPSAPGITRTTPP